MIIDCISDLHGNYPVLEGGGDLLLVAGDLTKRDTINEYRTFAHWLWEQDYRCKVFIAGNHDNKLKDFLLEWVPTCEAQYLEDSGYDFEGVKIWGSPWTTRFEGQNPHCCAYTVLEDKALAAKWDLIPRDTDILITHTPAFFSFDKTSDDEYVGSCSLAELLEYDMDIKLHVCGHIHEAYGHDYDGRRKRYDVNASHVNQQYKPVNKAIRIIL